MAKILGASVVVLAVLLAASGRSDASSANDRDILTLSVSANSDSVFGSVRKSRFGHAGTKVDLFRASGPSQRDAFLSTVSTGSDGYYSFHVERGACYIVVGIASEGEEFRHGTHAQKHVCLTGSHRGEEDPLTPVPAVVESDDEPVVDPILQAGLNLSIAGRGDSIIGSVAGLPAGDQSTMKIDLYEAESQTERSHLLAVTSTDQLGFFSFIGLESRCYIVVAEASSGLTFPYGRFAQLHLCLEVRDPGMTEHDGGDDDGDRPFNLDPASWRVRSTSGDESRLVGADGRFDFELVDSSGRTIAVFDGDVADRSLPTIEISDTVTDGTSPVGSVEADLTPTADGGLDYRLSATDLDGEDGDAFFALLRLNDSAGSRIGDDIQGPKTSATEPTTVLRGSLDDSDFTGSTLTQDGRLLVDADLFGCLERGVLNPDICSPPIGFAGPELDLPKPPPPSDTQLPNLEGICGVASVVLTVGGTGDLCLVYDGNLAGIAMSFGPAIGAVIPIVNSGGLGASIGAGFLLSNARDIRDLEGLNSCYGGSIEVKVGFEGTICQSFEIPRVRTGYIGAGVGIELGLSASLTYTYVHVPGPESQRVIADVVCDRISIGEFEIPTNVTNLSDACGTPLDGPIEFIRDVSNAI